MADYYDGDWTLSDGRGPILLGVTWTWTAVALALYVARAATAARATKDWPALFGIRWDFIWVTIALFTALCAEVFMTISVTYGTGIHQWELTDDQNIKSAFWSWLGQICAIFALVWGRFAVVAFLIGVQGRAFPKWRIALITVAVAQFLINTIEVGLILNQCTPVRRLWDFTVEGDCQLIEVCSEVGYLQGSIGAFSDFFLALYPPAVIIGPLQQMRPSIKFGLSLIMGGGVIAGIAGIVKTTSISSILKTDDISYATVDLLIWVMTEVWFIIIFGSIPTIRTVFLTAGRRIKVVLSRTDGGSKNSRRRSQDQWANISHAQGFRTLVDSPGGVATRHVRSNPKSWDRPNSEEKSMTPDSSSNILVTTEVTTVARPRPGV